MSGDLISFYKKYDNLQGEMGALTRNEKDQLNINLNEITDSIAKSKIK
jgi:hypothetical protein